MSRVRDIANILSGATDMATDAEVTSSIASHAAAADPHTVYLKTATASSTYAPLSNPTFTTIGGDEGGQINLGAAATNTTLSGNVALDINQNRLRFFESGGTNRGYYLDISAGAASAGTNLGSSGGWTLIASQALTSQSTFNFSSIPSGYRDLVVVIENVRLTQNNTAYILMRINGNATAANYIYRYLSSAGGNVVSGTSNDFIQVSPNAGTINNGAIHNGFVHIPNYANSASRGQIVQFSCGWSRVSEASGVGWFWGFGQSGSANQYTGGAVTSLTFFTPSDTFIAGTFYLYGVK